MKNLFYQTPKVPSRFPLIVNFNVFFQTDDELDDDVEDDMDADEEYDSDKKEKMRELISKKLQKEKGAEKTAEPSEDERGKKPSRRYDCMFQHPTDIQQIPNRWRVCLINSLIFALVTNSFSCIIQCLLQL